MQDADPARIMRMRLMYNPFSGVFTYRVPVAQMRAGDVAGRPNTNGHIQISINNHRYMAHNLAWLWLTGEYPRGFTVDHENRLYSDNRASNLRRATWLQNCANHKKSRANKSGVSNVYWRKHEGVWAMQVTLYGKRVFERHHNKETAEVRAVELKLQAFGEFANVSA